MTNRKIIAAISEARARLPDTTWEHLVLALQTEVEAISPSGIERVLDRVGNAEVRHRLEDAFAEKHGISWSVALVAAETASYWAKQAQASVDMVWTGPSSGSFTARRIDQILYDLLAGAKEQVFLITFAAYRVARLSATLCAAQARGVKITLLLETAVDSDGQLSNNALDAFSDLRLDQIEVLQWPKANRSLNSAGKPGKLHAKCAVVDDAVVISSANLTDDAFNRNMEMGVVAHDARLAESMRQHFRELKNTGILKVISR